jgi:RNA polymerase-binding transcription factor DksA
MSLADLLTDVTHAEIGRDIDEVRDIEAALHRIAAGSYAICTRCDQPIERGRLDAHPTEKRCLACRRLHERSRLPRQGRTLQSRLFSLAAGIPWAAGCGSIRQRPPSG